VFDAEKRVAIAAMDRVMGHTGMDIARKKAAPFRNTSAKI
jgi:hypothetical protein